MKLPESMTTVTPFTKILAMLLFVSLPFVGFYIGKAYQAGFCPGNVFECGDAAVRDDEAVEDEVAEEEEEGEEVSELESYTLDLGDGSITVPEGWYVSGVLADYEVSPDRIMDLLTTPPLSDGWYPIYQRSEITLTNGTSSMMVYETQDVVGGPWGANFENMPEGYTVVLEPTEDDEGFARKETGGTYEYITVYYCSDPVFCDEYAVISGEPFSMGGEFAGDASDLSTADDIYEDMVLDGNFPAIEE